jgi:hypothetical protein
MGLLLASPHHAQQPSGMNGVFVYTALGKYLIPKASKTAVVNLGCACSAGTALELQSHCASPLGQQTDATPHVLLRKKQSRGRPEAAQCRGRD